MNRSLSPQLFPHFAAESEIRNRQQVARRARQLEGQIQQHVIAADFNPAWRAKVRRAAFLIARLEAAERAWLSGGEFDLRTYRQMCELAHALLDKISLYRTWDKLTNDEAHARFKKQKK